MRRMGTTRATKPAVHVAVDADEGAAKKSELEEAEKRQHMTIVREKTPKSQRYLVQDSLEVTLQLQCGGIESVGDVVVVVSRPAP